MRLRWKTIFVELFIRIRKTQLTFQMVFGRLGLRFTPQVDGMSFFLSIRFLELIQRTILKQATKSTRKVALFIPIKYSETPELSLNSQKLRQSSFWYITSKSRQSCQKLTSTGAKRFLAGSHGRTITTRLYGLWKLQLQYLGLSSVSREIMEGNFSSLRATVLVQTSLVGSSWPLRRGFATGSVGGIRRALNPGTQTSKKSPNLINLP